MPLQEIKGRKGRLLSLHTVRTQLQHLMILLNKAGPPGPRNRDAAGFIAHSPWVKRPRAEESEPITVPESSINKCYEGAVAMQTPRIAGVCPGNWWRALLVVALNMGLRSRTLFALRVAWIDWEQRSIAIPAAALRDAASSPCR